MKDAKLLKSLFILAAERSLSTNSELLNALNVFPVPDGDTGTNMTLTARGMVEANVDEEAALGDAARAAYKACLLNARGNSGLLLSYFYKALSDALQESDGLSGAAVADALANSAVDAAGAMPDPREGTIITVLREAGASAQREAAAGAGLERVLEVAGQQAADTVRRTPEMMDVLRDAGVVDSGGMGVMVVLRGALVKLRGEGEGAAAIDPEEFGVARDVKIGSEFLDVAEEEEWGYCTAFAINSTALAVDKIRGHLEQNGRSVLVLGDERTLKVHIHTEDPGSILSYAVGHGDLSNIDIKNMTLQAANWTEERREAGGSDGGGGEGSAAEDVETGMVVVAEGLGMLKLFQHFDATAVTVVDGGPLMNPDVETVLKAVQGNVATDVLVLPNSGDLIAVAEAAAGLAEGKRVKVVPTRSMAEGMALMVDFVPQTGLDENVQTLEADIGDLVHGSVSRASRAATLDGVEFGEGQYIATVRGRVVLVADTAEEALARALGEHAEEESACFIYYGADVPAGRAAGLLEELRERLPELEITDVANGGQSHHDYLFSAEP